MTFLAAQEHFHIGVIVLFAQLDIIAQLED